MKLISGNYGLGKVKLTDNGFIISRTGRELPFSSIKAIESKVRKNKEQSIGSVLIGLIIITPILFLLFNIIGLVIGIVLSLAGSQYTTKSYSSEITFNDNTKLKVECNRWQMNKLSDLSQTP